MLHLFSCNSSSSFADVSFLSQITFCCLHPITSFSSRVGSYDERRFLDDRYAYPLDRDACPPPPSAGGFWPQSRRRNYEDEYPLERESRRHEKPYIDAYNEMDTFRDRDSSFQDYDKLRDGYHGIDNLRDRDLDRPARLGGRDRDDYPYDDYGHRPRTSQHREDSREKDYGHGRHSYDSDYDKSSRRDVNFRRREYRDREHDKRSLNRERDHSPYGRYEPSRSRSRSRSPSRSRSHGRDDHIKSRSPRSRSHGRSHREDSYDDDRYDRPERRRDREDKRQREHYGVVCELYISLPFHLFILQLWIGLT